MEPDIHWYNTIRREVVDRDCYRFKSWEPSLLRKAAGLNIVDVGANVGAFSAMAAARFPTARIYSFEMMKDNYEFAREGLNVYDNVTLLNRALVGSNQPVGLYEHANNPGGHKPIFDDTTETYLNARDFDAPFAEQEVRSVSMLQFMDEAFIDQIDFLKLDCEGSEYEILFHVDEHGLWNKISRISMELHGRGDKPRVDKLMNMLRENYSNVVIQGINMVHCEKQ